MIKMFDGAMGTQLQALGIAGRPCPEYACIIDPDAVTGIHRQYVEAGADIIETNTFGANRLKLDNFGLGGEVDKLTRAAVRAARAACGPDTLVAGAAGPTGQLILPLGERSFDEIASVYEEQIKALAGAGVDYILLETILDIQEMRSAVLAAKAVCRLPVIAQLTFGGDGRTITGTDASTAAAILEPLGVSVIGMNCSLGPEQLLPLVRELSAATALPVSVQPNAGLPALVDGQTVFPLSPEDMAGWAPELAAEGASFIGGCCGTTPGHIAAMKQALAGCRPAARQPLPPGVRLASRSRTLWLGTGHPTALIGERINPTGRKALAEELRTGSLLTVKQDALAQVAAGAALLDVNMGVPGLDQAALLQRAVIELSALVDVPLALDSIQPEVLAAGLKYFPGRALINSVSAKQPDELLSLAKRYGAAVIVLPLAEKELPATAEERLAIARTVIQAAGEHGLGAGDLVLDALVLTAASDGRAPGETLRALRLYKEHIGYPTTLGLSNVSFGLPNRGVINTAFFLMALANGLDAPIINPLADNIADLLAAARVINGQDSQGISFSARYIRKSGEPAGQAAAPADVLAALRQAVGRGEKERAAALALDAYTAGHTVAEITDKALSAAMEEVGDKFSRGRAFLPQVMLAAEAMREAFILLKSKLGDGARIQSRGKVLLATVEGDIHDLGKNIVAALLTNNGFTVIDLGKDVPAGAVLAAAQKEKPDIVGLCALMTTTLGAMAECIAGLKQAGYPGGVMVGGAVLTAEYAAQIGADMYARDGVAAVKLARRQTAGRRD